MTVLAAARTGEVAGREVALDYGDVAREYGALRTSAMLVDRSHRGRMRFTGEKARELLTGLVTNDVLALAPGDGCYACALTAKGKIVSDLRVLATADGALVDFPARAATGFRDLIRKYINPRSVKYAAADDDLSQLGVFGVNARHVVSVASGISEEALESLRSYSHLTVENTLVMRNVELGLAGYELFVPRSDAADHWTELSRAGAVPGGLEAWEIARVEAGRPEWGIDMDENTLAQEANMEELHAVSFTKGCYTGQETVARVHFRGHVNRHLRAVRHRHAEPIPTGADLVAADDRVVGEIKTSVISPRLGAIAMAMVRREVELPAALAARWDGVRCDADLYALPFPL